MEATVRKLQSLDNSETRSSSKKFLVAIFAAAAVLRIVSFFLSENAGGDALARAQLTAHWLHTPRLEFHFDVWLPLHFWLMAAVSLVVGEVDLGARLLSLMTGIASVGALWLLTKELDGDKAALFSSILFSFYSLHIAYSATSSCDVPYLLFVIAGLALFFKGRRENSFWVLVLSGLSLTIGAGIRYEAWIIIAALNAILLFRREVKNLGLFLPASVAWPAFWMVGWLRPRVPGMSFRRIGAIAPVIGSLSLNAIRNGSSLAESTSHAARLASLAGSSGRVGTRPGMARAPALARSSGNGAS